MALLELQIYPDFKSPTDWCVGPFKDAKSVETCMERRTQNPPLFRQAIFHSLKPNMTGA